MSALNRLRPGVCLLLLYLAGVSGQAVAEAIEVYYGPSREYQSKTWVHSDYAFHLLEARYGWIYIEGVNLSGWVLADDLVASGRLLLSDRLALAADDKFFPWQLEWFWQPQGAVGVAVQMPWRSLTDVKQPGMRMLADIWPGEDESVVLRYHRADSGLQAWHALTAGVDSRMANIGRWEWHAWIGAGMGINEEFSTHWDDQGAALTVPLVGAGIDFRRLLMSGLSVGVRMENLQALSGNQAGYGSMSLVWVLML